MFALARFVGHRGVAGLKAENTAAGIAAAARYFNWIEVDARAAADGVAVLSHDDSLRRCFGNAARVSRLRAATAAARGAPLLAESLAQAKKLKLKINVEIKANKNDEAKAAAAAAAALMQHGGANVLASSFNVAALLHLRALMPKQPLALNLNAPNKNWRKQCQALRAKNAHINHRNFTAAHIRAFKSAGLGVYCFTVNCPRRQQELFAQGADGVFTDYPPPPLAVASAKAPRRQATPPRTKRRQTPTRCRQ